MMTLESMMLPLPSEIIMPLAGWLLVGKVAGPVPIWLQVGLTGLAGALGCLIGSCLAYWIGQAGGRFLVEKYGQYVLIRPEHLDTSEKWVARWGTYAAFFSRLLPVVRTFVSLPMGVSRSRFIPFAILTFVGSFIWSLGLAWLGYLLGPKFDQVRSSSGWLDYLIVIALAGLVVYFVYTSFKHHPSPSPKD